MSQTFEGSSHDSHKSEPEVLVGNVWIKSDTIYSMDVDVEMPSGTKIILQRSSLKTNNHKFFAPKGHYIEYSKMSDGAYQIESVSGHGVDWEAHDLTCITGDCADGGHGFSG